MPYKDKAKEALRKKAYAIENADAIRAKRRDYYLANRETIIRKNTKYYRLNKSECNARHKRHRKANPQWYITYEAKRRVKHALESLHWYYANRDRILAARQTPEYREAKKFYALSQRKARRITASKY